MSAQRNSTITAYFPAKSNDKGKSEKAIPSPSPPEIDAKDKGKRKTSPSPPPDKRRNTSAPSSSTPKHLSYKDLSTTWLSQVQAKSNDETRKLSLSAHQGDIFAAPAHTLLIHACNTQGSWGAGIALAFKTAYPKAYTIYRNFCIKEHDPKAKPIPTGTALLIPPVDGDKKHWIGCLFTSARYGKGKDKAAVIVRNTVPAMQMLLDLVERTDGIEVVRMCKINSGKFGVPWEHTAAVLEKIEVQDGWWTNVEIWEPEE